MGSYRPHGTHVKYVVDKCRCDECRQANTDYERRRSRRLEPPYVAAAAARAHVRELTAAGVGLKRIAEVSGVSHGSLTRLIYGSRDRGPSARVRRSTEQKLLAVTPAAIAGGARVDAGPTWALIDEMVAAGAPKSEISRHIGQGGKALQLSKTSVSARNARAVAALHADWIAGRVTLGRADRWGSRTIAAAPVVSPRPAADISELLLDLAEIVEERIEQAEWRASAACRDRPIHLWFPGRGDIETTEAGQKICGACIVRDQCRAANFNKREGTYGGLPAGARRRVKQLDATPVVRAAIAHGTDAGYRAHRRRGEEACVSCREAHRPYQQHTRPSRAVS